ncbi:3'-5' exoribonuclease [Candidatus Daviesbacteria bacterium]|nr:3'-5' exoribonuclease [Candidatus Daviesbacteria bacterium]
MKEEQSLAEKRQLIYDRGREIVMNAPQLYVDVDVEADGIAGYGSMLSIGAQSPTGEAFYSEIKPLFEEFIPGNRKFCEDHNLSHERLLLEASDYQSVMGNFYKWIEGLKKADIGKSAVFTAFNAAYDWAFIDLYFTKAGFENPFGIAPFDLKSLALPLTGNWDWKMTSKSRLPSIIIPDGDFTHHALEDAQYQQKLHFGMAGLLGKRNYLDIAHY